MQVQVGLDGIALAESINGPEIRLTRAEVYRALAAEPNGQPNTARFWSESHWAGLSLAQALASTPLSTAAQEMAEGPSVASG